MKGIKKPSPVDRFISSRAGVDHQATRSKIFCERKDPATEGDDMFKQSPKAWRMRSYARLLGERCGLSDGPSEPLLRHTQGGGRPRPRPEASAPRGWSCAPRKKPVILQPDVIFDLPGYEESMYNDILDWSSRNLVVAGLGDQVFMLNSTTNQVSKLHTFEYSTDSIIVVKWDPHGIFIAMGTVQGHLYIYDTNSNKLVPIPDECHRARNEQDASMTAIAWEPTGKQIACCTSAGTVSLCNGNIMRTNSVRKSAHDMAIINCSYSPNMKYLVTCGVDCNVRIWCLPDLSPYFQIVYAHPARALAWHPWRGCQLAVGGGLGPFKGHGDGSLSIWDVSLQANLCHQLPTTRCGVDALAWSHLTGELVVSYWVEDTLQQNIDSWAYGHSRLLVLAAPGRATDEMCTPSGRTRALLFSPDGTKIASASSDENLFIWNFLGGGGPLLNMYKRKIKKTKMSRVTNHINEFNNFGFTVR